MNSFDPNLFAALNNGGMGGFGGGNLWWVILFALFWSRGNYGSFSGGYTPEMNTLIMNGAQGNRMAISELASSLNCSVGQINTILSNIQSTIQNVGAQNNLSFAQTINAIQSGDANIISTLQNCCCGIKELVTTQGYETRINNLQQSQLIQNGFSQIGYAAAENTCAIKQNATDNTGRILAKLDAIEDSRKDREISSLTAALTAANSRAERQAELAPLYKAVGDIQCKLPQTYNVPYQPFTAIPNCLAAQYGLYGNVFGNGVFA